MKIRYFAGAAGAAGRDAQLFDGPATPDDLRARLADEHGVEFQRVLSYCSLLVDGARVGDGEVIGDAATVDVLPPFAGG